MTTTTATTTTTTKIEARLGRADCASELNVEAADRVVRRESIANGYSTRAEGTARTAPASLMLRAARPDSAALSRSMPAHSSFISWLEQRLGHEKRCEVKRRGEKRRKEKRRGEERGEEGRREERRRGQGRGEEKEEKRRRVSDDDVLSCSTPAHSASIATAPSKTSALQGRPNMCQLTAAAGIIHRDCSCRP